MNYIQRLERDCDQMNEELGQMRDGIAQLRAHLQSSKFHVDTTIQVSDVQAWLAGILDGSIGEVPSE